VQTESHRLLRLSEFASVLRLTPSCVRRWISQGRVTSVRIGRRLVIPRTEIERLIRQGTRPAQTIKQSRTPDQI
jgi:excisionase family DNA binding protein